MKSRFKIFLAIFIVFSCFGKYITAQNSEHRSGPRFAIVVQHPLLLGIDDESNGKLSLYQLGIETNWQSKKHKYRYSSFRFLYGRFFNSENPWDGTQSMFEINYSMFWRTKNHFFELGLGTDNLGLTKAIIGYRLYLSRNFLVNAQFIPTSGFLLDLVGGMENVPNFLDFSFGVGYQFNQFDSRKMSNAVRFFINRSSVEIGVYLVRFVKYESGPEPPFVFNYGFVPFRSDNFHFIINGGVGHLSGGDYFYQAGVGTLYGKDRHFLEAGVNFIFALLRNPNFEYKYSEYVLVQPQIGYRYQFAKNRLFAKIAYAPYIRVLNWKREGGLQQNMVLGLGYRLGK